MGKTKSIVLTLSIAVLLLSGSTVSAGTCAEAATILKQSEHQLASDFMAHKGPETLRTGSVNLLEAINGVSASCANAFSPQCLSEIESAQRLGGELIAVIDSGSRNPAVVAGAVKLLLNSLISVRRECGIDALVAPEKIQREWSAAIKKPVLTLEEQNCVDGKFELRYFYQKFQEALQISNDAAKTAIIKLIESINFTQQSCSKQLSTECRKSLTQLNFYSNAYKELANNADATKIIKNISSAFRTAAQACPLDTKTSDYSKSVDSQTGNTETADAAGGRRNRRNLAGSVNPTGKIPNGPIPYPKEQKPTHAPVGAACEAAEKSFFETVNQMRKDFTEHKGKFENSSGFTAFILSISNVQKNCKGQLQTECAQGFQSMSIAATQLADVVKQNKEQREEEARAIRMEIFKSIKTTRFECDLFRFVESEESKRNFRRRI